MRRPKGTSSLNLLSYRLSNAPLTTRWAAFFVHLYVKKKETTRATSERSERGARNQYLMLKDAKRNYG